MTNDGRNEEIAKRLAGVYGLHVSEDVIASALAGRPKLPILLSRASFRANIDVRTNQRTRIRSDRRKFLRAMFGLAVVSASAVILMSIVSTPTVSNPQTETTSVPSISSNPTNVASNPTIQSGQPIANAANLPLGQSLTYNDPALGPIILIHLDNGQFVAYSAICTHAGCQVQFDPSLNDLICPCHGAVYDPYHNAQVLGGPAPYPLQNVPIQYNASTGAIYLAG